MRFNKTSINKEVVSKILGACKEALSNESGQAYINNKKGAPFIRVKRIKKVDGNVGFQVLYKDQTNIAPLIAQTLVLENKGPEITNKSFAVGLANFINKRVAFPFEIAHTTA